MIPKAQRPNLNRAMRRHPRKYRDMMLPRGNGMSYLLTVLLIRAGLMAPDYDLKDTVTGRVFSRSFKSGPDNQNVPKPGIIAKAKSFFRRMIGG